MRIERTIASGIATKINFHPTATPYSLDANPLVAGAIVACKTAEVGMQIVFATI